MLKKLSALLFALLLAVAPALAESPLLARAYTKAVLEAVCSALDAQEIAYERDDEYDGCFLSFDAEAPSSLGEVIYTGAYAYEDGVNIISTFAEYVPADKLNELILLCNHFTCETYLGKFYIDLYDNSLNYEVFIPLDPTDIRDFDLALIGEYTYLTAAMLEYHQEYFLEVLDKGESAANVIAMWYADQE